MNSKDLDSLLKRKIYVSWYTLIILYYYNYDIIEVNILLSRQL